jgi:hypothetical protein
MKHQFILTYMNKTVTARANAERLRRSSQYGNKVTFMCSWNFYCAVGNYTTQSRMVGLQMNDELERTWNEAAAARSRYYPGICLEGTFMK